MCILLTKLTQEVMFVTCIQKMPNSNFGHNSILMEGFMVLFSLSVLIVGEYLQKVTTTCLQSFNLLEKDLGN